MKCVFSATMPHAPIIIPEIGGVRSRDVQTTTASCNYIAEQLHQSDPDFIMLFSPHTPPVQPGYISIRPSRNMQTDFSQFGAPALSYEINGLGQKLAPVYQQLVNSYSKKTVLTDTRLDHGAGVPLYFFHKAGITKPFFICSPDYYSLEGSIKAAAAFSDSLSGRDLKFAAIASADLSHALKPGAPAGFDPRGQKFDDQLTAFIKSREYTKIKTINPELQQLAHQDAMETIMMALTLSNFKTNNSRFLSYENEFGVGYLCAVLSCT